MPLLILFLLLPLVEIWLFVRVGEIIGAWQTAGLVVLMAIIGATLVRIQGFTVVNRARATLAAGEFPTTDLLDGLFVLIAGFLLIVPGFLTDIIGLLLFIPPVRRWLGASIWDWISHRPNIVIHRYGRPGGSGGGFGGAPGGSGRVVEGTYHEIRPEDAPSDPAIGPPRNHRP
jgi:UPF0716 protein FxsA